MIKVAKCLSDDYIHSYRLKNFCYEHKMPVSEIKSDYRCMPKIAD